MKTLQGFRDENLPFSYLCDRQLTPYSLPEGATRQAKAALQVGIALNRSRWHSIHTAMLKFDENRKDSIESKALENNLHHAVKCLESVRLWAAPHIKDETALQSWDAVIDAAVGTLLQLVEHSDIEWIEGKIDECTREDGRRFGYDSPTSFLDHLVQLRVDKYFIAELRATLVGRTAELFEAWLSLGELLDQVLCRRDVVRFIWEEVDNPTPSASLFAQAPEEPEGMGIVPSSTRSFNRVPGELLPETDWANRVRSQYRKIDPEERLASNVEANLEAITSARGENDYGRFREQVSRCMTLALEQAEMADRLPRCPAEAVTILSTSDAESVREGNESAAAGALAGTKNDILQFLWEQQVFSDAARRTAEEIAKGVKGKQATNQFLKHPLSDLVKAGLLVSKRNRAGGYWLSSTGKTKARECFKVDATSQASRLDSTSSLLSKIQGKIV